MTKTSTTRTAAAAARDPWDDALWDDMEEDSQVGWTKSYRGGVKHRTYGMERES